MAHEAAYLSAMVDTTTKFLEALEKLPIRGDEAGNVAKLHPMYPRGFMYTQMFVATEAMLAAYRPMVIPAESFWEAGNLWPLTALNAVNLILSETFGIVFQYGVNSETGKRVTNLHFNNRMLHDRRIGGIAHPSIPETMEPYPEVDPRHIALVRTAVEEMRRIIFELRAKEGVLAEANRICAELDAKTVSQLEKIVEPPKHRDLRPKVYLIGWPDILGALERKNNSEGRSLVRTLNASEQHPGPIRSTGQGTKPRVEKGKLIEWWNGLEDSFDQSDARQSNKVATVASRHQFGRGALVVPGISGEVKKRRGGKHPPTS